MNKLTRHVLLAAACATLMSSACAQVSVTAPWVRATVAAQTTTGAYMHLMSVKGARLVGVRTPAAARAELHRMDMQGDMMKMRQVDGIDLPAGKAVNLASGSYHIMLVGLKRRLKEGETLDLTLDVLHANKQRASVTLKVPVKPMTFVSPAQGGTPMAH